MRKTVRRSSLVVPITVSGKAGRENCLSCCPDTVLSGERLIPAAGRYATCSRAGKESSVCRAAFIISAQTERRWGNVFHCSAASFYRGVQSLSLLPRIPRKKSLAPILWTSQTRRNSPVLRSRTASSNVSRWDMKTALITAQAASQWGKSGPRSNMMVSGNWTGREEKIPVSRSRREEEKPCQSNGNETVLS